MLADSETAGSRRSEGPSRTRQAWRRRRIHRYTAFVLVLFACWAALGPLQGRAAIPLERDFTVRAWRHEHGLPDSRVLSVLCSRAGPIWVGTRKGVARFDGARFLTWGRGTDPDFTSEECIALAEDAEGVIWVGTPENLLALDDRARRIDPAAVGLAGLFPEGQMPASVLLVTREGDLLVGTGRGVVRRNASGQWSAHSLAPAGHRRESTYSLHQDPATGQLWASLDWRLLRLSPASLEWQCAFDNNLVQDGRHVVATTSLPDAACIAIREVWPAQTSRLEVLRDGRWEALVDREISNAANTPYLLVDAQQRLWFPLDGATMGCWQAGRLLEYALPAFLAGDRLSCLRQDTEGNLWAGTARNGLLCFRPRRIRTLDPSPATADPRTYALVETSRNQLVAGTDGGPAWLRDGDWLPFVTVHSPIPGQIRALAVDARGVLWIGARTGLQSWDGRQLQSVSYAGPAHRTKIRTIRPARDGSIWVGTAQGLFRFGPQSTNGWGVADGLPHENVSALLEDRQGTIWIGTGGGGVARWTGRGFERFGVALGLSSDRVSCLLEDADGLIWAGTDRGLNVLRHGRFTAITTDQHLPENLVNALAEDDRGWLWVGHDRGVYRVNRSDLLALADGRGQAARWVEYAEADGMANTECNGQISAPAALRLHDGRIAFATMGGVVVFDPAALPDLTNGPPVLLEELRAGGIHPEGSSLRVPLRQHRAGNQVLRIPASARALLDIRYTAVDVHAPERIAFRYRLLGLSEKWMEAGAIRQAAFANLPPGPYTFQVQALNRHGYWSRSPASLAFIAEPRWHERPAARVAGVLGLLAVAFALFRWRLGELRRFSRLERQAALARERTRLARDLHDGLGSNLTEITMLSHVDDSHPLPPESVAQRLPRLARSAQEASLALRDLIWMTNPEADSLPLLASRIHAAAERVLDAAGIRCIVDAPPEWPDLPVGPALRRDLLLAANEAVHNAIRHAQARQVHLTFACPDHHWVLTIADDGHGIVPGPPPDADRPPHTGLGLASLHQRLAAHGGECRIESQPGQGTRVTLRVPLPRPLDN